MKLKMLARLLAPAEAQESAAGGASEKVPEGPEVMTAHELEEDDTDWGALADEPDLIEETLLEEEETGEAADDASDEEDEEPQAKAPEKPVTPPAPVQAKTPTEEVPPAPVVQGQEPAPPQPQQPAPQVQPTVSPEEQAAKYASWRDGHVKSLASQYTISDEEAAQILTDPEKVLPQMLAKVHMNALESAVNAITNALPGMLQAHTQQTRTLTQAQDLFSEINPDLTSPEYGQIVAQAAQMYKASPKAKKDPREAFKDIGNMVRVALQLPIPEPAAPAPAAAPAPSGSVPPRPVGQRQAVPFQPPRGGGALPAGATGNVWEQLAEELLEDD